MAAAVARQLKALGVEVEVVSVGSVDSEFAVPPAEARERLGVPPSEASNYTWDRAYLSRGHLGVRFKLGKYCYTFDSTTLARRVYSFGSRGDKCAYPFGMGLTPEEATRMANTRAGWNRRFNRRAHKPTVERMVVAAFA